MPLTVFTWLFQMPLKIFTWPFQWVGSAVHVLSASTRFAKNYAGRDRRRRPRLYTRHLGRDSTEEYSENREEEESASASEAGTRSAAVELPAYNTKSGGAVCRMCSQQKPKTGLRRLLCLDETMEAMAKNLHASDIRHLGQVSRGIRMSLYTHIGTYARSEDTELGTLDFVPLQKKSLFRVEEILTHAERTELLSRGSCKYGERDRCWSCDIQICSLCNYQSQASVTDIQRHIDNCTLYCHKCYFREICLKQRRPLRHPRRCSHSTKLGGPRDMRSLCKPCSEMPDKDISVRRERREKGKLALLAAQAVRCANCASGLPSGGVRWWVCTLCDLECTDSCHH